MPGFVGLGVHLVVWALLLILTPDHVGISQVVKKKTKQKNKIKNKQTNRGWKEKTNIDPELQKAGSWSWHFLTFSVCLYGYCGNCVKILHSYQRCWLI